LRLLSHWPLVHLCRGTFYLSLLAGAVGTIARSSRAGPSNDARTDLLGCR